MGSTSYYIYIFVLLHATVILQNSFGFIFSMIILTPSIWMHLHRVFRAVCFVVVNFETDINVIFCKLSYPVKKCTVVPNWYTCSAIQTELKEQKLQPHSLGFFYVNIMLIHKGKSTQTFKSPRVKQIE